MYQSLTNVLLKKNYREWRPVREKNTQCANRPILFILDIVLLQLAVYLEWRVLSRGTVVPLK